MTLQLKLPKPWVIAVATIVVLVAIFAVTCVWPWVETHRLIGELDSIGRFAVTRDVLPEWFVDPVKKHWPSAGKYLPRRLEGGILYGPKIDDQFLRRVAAQRTVTGIALWATSVTPEGLKILEKCPALQELDILSMQVTDDDLACLRSFSKLRALGFNNTPVTGTCFRDLSTSSIVAVSLNECPVSVAGMREIAKLSNLECVEFINLHISPDLLAPLAGCRTLKVLEIKGCQLIEMQATEVPRIGSLQDLDLSRTQGSPAAFRNLLLCQTAESVCLQMTPIDDSVLQSLQSCQSLESLELQSTNVSSDAVRSLIENSNVTSVGLSHTDAFANACLPANRVAEIVRGGLEAGTTCEIQIEPRKAE